MNHRVTMKDLARQLGLSTGTIHRALSGKAGVGKEVRQKVIEAAEREGYQLNSIASVLKRKPLRIVVSFPDLSQETRYYYSDIWEGYRNYRKELNDYQIEFIEAPYGIRENQQADVLRNTYQNIVQGNGIDGLLTVGPMDEVTRRVVQDYCAEEIATVFVNEDNEKCNRICCVRANYKIAGRLMAEQISNLVPPDGSVLLIAGDRNISAHNLQVEGFFEYIKEHTVPLDVIRMHKYDQVEEEETELHNTITQSQDIVAICCVNARESALVAKFIKKHNLAGKYRIIGSDVFDESANALAAGIFTNLIYKSAYQIGYFGTKILTDYLIKDQQPDSTECLLDCDMVFRSNLYLYNDNLYRNTIHKFDR
ncbi:substrate-binding domain-containing protein [Sporomusa aerivorans]|uniref:substrate-binding domain-containing protein n=1 Tax=Sporomusa aerivorans TaxID=204936 RepID=UPI00352B7656